MQIECLLADYLSLEILNLKLSTSYFVGSILHIINIDLLGTRKGIPSRYSLEKGYIMVPLPTHYVLVPFGSRYGTSTSLPKY